MTQFPEVKNAQIVCGIRWHGDAQNITSGHFKSHACKKQGSGQSCI